MKRMDKATRAGVVVEGVNFDVKFGLDGEAVFVIVRGTLKIKYFEGEGCAGHYVSIPLGDASEWFYFDRLTQEEVLAFITESKERLQEKAQELTNGINTLDRIIEFLSAKHYVEVYNRYSDC